MATFPTDRAGLREYSQRHAVMSEYDELRRPVKSAKGVMLDALQAFVESEAAKILEKEKVGEGPVEKEA